MMSEHGLLFVFPLHILFLVCFDRSLIVLLSGVCCACLPLIVHTLPRLLRLLSLSFSLPLQAHSCLKTQGITSLVMHGDSLMRMLFGDVAKLLQLSDKSQAELKTLAKSKAMVWNGLIRRSSYTVFPVLLCCIPLHCIELYYGHKTLILITSLYYCIVVESKQNRTAQLH